MKEKIPVAMLFTLCLTLCSCASDKVGFTGSLIWEVSGNGLDKPSYIIGTHHFASTKFMEELAGFKKTLEAVDQVYGELKTSDFGEIQVKIMSEALMPDSITYADLLSESDYQKLNEGLTMTLGVGLRYLGKYKPGLINSMYSAALYAKTDPEFSVFTHESPDVYIQKLASQQDKECFGLETIEEQIAILFDSEPLKIQAEQLACGIRYMNEGIEMLKKLNHYYYNGDLDKMYDITFNNPIDYCPSSESYNAALNKDRNDKWLEKMPAIMAVKATLFAVGALHLAGEEGLLEKLHKMGYTISVVK